MSVKAVRILKVDDAGNEFEEVICVGDKEVVGERILLTVKSIEILESKPQFYVS